MKTTAPVIAILALTFAACGEPSDTSLVNGRDAGTGTDGGNGGGSGDSDRGVRTGDAGRLPDGAFAGDSGAGGGDGGGGGSNCADLKNRADTTSAPANASWRYGGGVGYPDAVARDDDCMTVVSSRQELVAALEGAAAGDIVYVDDDARIDVSGSPIEIPGGVWLASGRGVDGSAGALLYGTEVVNRPLLVTTGPNVRLTGLRLFGPDPDQCPPQYPNNCTGTDRTGGTNCRDCMPVTSGIRTGEDNLEVDNVELAGFGLAAVALSDSVGHRVHHSHIHHNQRQGLGYGVLLGRGDTGVIQVLVDHNRMDYMRHAIAGSGEPGQDYEARDNLYLEHANGHVFDMHGENENTDNGSELAGGEILIHRNTVLVDTHYTLVVRGRPQTGAWMYDNCLSRSSSDAARQNFFYGNMYLDESPSGPAANEYNRTGPQCETQRWCAAAGGAGPWRYLAASSNQLGSLGFGDFDGDGKTDVFNATGSKWQWVSGGTGGWQDLNVSSFRLERLAFGDFDGDGTTDVFNANGSIWRYSPGGSSGWTELRSAPETLDQLRFGDFNGDGKTDVFTATGSEFRVSYGGSSGWQRLNGSSYALSRLRFGDFDGDGKTDAFTTSDGSWQWSSGASSGWQDLNASGVSEANLVFADVNGDGRTDALRQNGSGWYVSHGASQGWQRLRVDSRSRSSVAFGDFDGDGSDDMFRTGCF